MFLKIPVSPAVHNLRSFLSTTFQLLNCSLLQVFVRNKKLDKGDIDLRVFLMSSYMTGPHLSVHESMQNKWRTRTFRGSQAFVGKNSSTSNHSNKISFNYNTIIALLLNPLFPSIPLPLYPSLPQLRSYPFLQVSFFGHHSTVSYLSAYLSLSPHPSRDFSRHVSPLPSSPTLPPGELASRRGSAGPHLQPDCLLHYADKKLTVGGCAAANPIPIVARLRLTPNPRFEIPSFWAWS